jgi:hypothetical protein
MRAVEELPVSQGSRSEDRARKQIRHKNYETWREVLIEEQPQSTVILSGMLAKNS